jgi:hypothetical protein
MVLSLPLLLDGSMLDEVDGFSRARVHMSHPRPVGVTGRPIRTRLKRSRPGAMVEITEMSDPGGASSQV